MKLGDCISLIPAELLWILTRERDAAGVNMTAVLEKVTDLGLDTTSLIETDQTDCTN